MVEGSRAISMGGNWILRSNGKLDRFENLGKTLKEFSKQQRDELLAWLDAGVFSSDKDQDQKLNGQSSGN
mgnify:CR=1 FL=1